MKSPRLRFVGKEVETTTITQQQESTNSVPTVLPTTLKIINKSSAINYHSWNILLTFGLLFSNKF